jgi:8-oxo-dGTP pyrophosphatase MutT (NUDIX family)
VSLAKLELPGTKEPFYYFHLNDYVSVIAINDQNEVALVKQFRPTLNRFTLELPGGIIENGDTPLMTARQELLEETGLILDEVVAELEPRYIDAARLSGKNHTFVVRSSSVPGSNPEDSIELRWMPKQLLLGFLKSGELSLESHAGVIAQALLFEYI